MIKNVLLLLVVVLCAVAEKPYIIKKFYSLFPQNDILKAQVRFKEIIPDVTEYPNDLFLEQESPIYVHAYDKDVWQAKKYDSDFQQVKDELMSFVCQYDTETGQTFTYLEQQPSGADLSAHIIGSRGIDKIGISNEGGKTIFDKPPSERFCQFTTSGVTSRDIVNAKIDSRYLRTGCAMSQAGIEIAGSFSIKCYDPNSKSMTEIMNQWNQVLVTRDFFTYMKFQNLMDGKTPKIWPTVYSDVSKGYNPFKDQRSLYNVVKQKKP